MKEKNTLQSALAHFGLETTYSERAESSPETIISLTLNESGTLCHALLQYMLTTGGVETQTQWMLDLYEKIAAANDKLMGQT